MDVNLVGVEEAGDDAERHRAGAREADRRPSRLFHHVAELTGEDDLARLEDVAPLGDVERHEGVLLDQEHGDAFGIDPLDHAEHVIHHERRESAKELERLEALAAPVLELSEAAEILVRAHLIDAGYHRRKGEYRRARGEAKST